MMITNETRTKTTDPAVGSARPIATETETRRAGVGGEPTARRRSMVHRSPKAFRRAQEWTWRSPMTAAVLFGTVAVVLVCGYLHAYARAFAYGAETVRVNRAIRQTERENTQLNTEIGRASTPALVSQWAAKSDMIAPDGTATVLEITRPGTTINQGNH